ncbi:hypothetical protein TUM4249_33390 [Shewanella sp. KT0246]|nr:hypothetical protein TUM4249_33390 [Shewanella sp. KT0246]
MNKRKIAKVKDMKPLITMGSISVALISSIAVKLKVHALLNQHPNEPNMSLRRDFSDIKPLLTTATE